MTLYQQLHSRFSLENVRVGIRQETQSFEACLVAEKPDGTRTRIAHVVNYGRGDACTLRALPPMTQSWLLDELSPVIARGMAEQHARWADTYSKYPGEALSSFCFELLEKWSIGDQLARQMSRFGQTPDGTAGPYRRRAARPNHPAPNTEKFKVGQKVKFGRPNGEKTLGRVVKVNKKTLKVETLEDRGSKSTAGMFWRVPPSACEVVQ